MGKKVVVIGAGLAGLTAGVYALQSGFDVLVLEKHSIPGGICTSWKRGGYLFEGAIHWMIGTAEDEPMHKVWREVGALDDNITIHQKDPFLSYDDNGTQVCVYRDLNRLRDHFLALSPEDAKAINRLYKDAKAFTGMSMPLSDVPGVKVREKSGMSAGQIAGMMPAIPRMMALSNLSVEEYVAAFKHAGIRRVLSYVVGQGFSAMALVSTLGTLARGDGGYPEGGSLPMAHRMAERICSLGGTIKYNAAVQRVLIENGHATGVLVDGERIDADAVIVASDTRSAVDTLFEPKLEGGWIESMRQGTLPVMCSFVCVGVRVDLSNLPEGLVFTLPEPMEAGGMRIDTMGFNNYAGYAGYAPEGCTALTVTFAGQDTYGFWQSAKAQGRYKQEKQVLADAVTQALEKQLPQIKDRIDVVDVATPLTYERYCGTWRGSWMTLMPKGAKPTTYPGTVEGIAGLYFAGQRQMHPGGLPAAAATGRKAVQLLCRDEKQVFQGMV